MIKLDFHTSQEQRLKELSKRPSFATTDTSPISTTGGTISTAPAIDLFSTPSCSNGYCFSSASVHLLFVSQKGKSIREFPHEASPMFFLTDCFFLDYFQSFSTFYSVHCGNMPAFCHHASFCLNVWINFWGLAVSLQYDNSWSSKISIAINMLYLSCIWLTVQLLNSWAWVRIVL